MSRGRQYQRGGHVKDLAVSGDGRLLAYVMGGERYVTCVWLTGDRQQAKSIQSQCSCPVGDNGCKHAVAMVAEYLEQIALESDIPVADEDDPRWAVLRDGALDNGDEEDLDPADEFEEEDSEKVRARPVRSRSHADWDERIRRHIATKSREDLVELVLSLTERFTELRDEFRERIALEKGDVDKLVSEARRELRKVTSEMGWRNHWTGEGHTPDFSKLKHRLERMAELGHADAVVRLGEEIIESGMELVGNSNDEGETATEFASCLPVIFQSVTQSTLLPEKQLIFTIDAYLKDDYDIIGEAGDVVMDKKFAREEWSKVADALASRLGGHGVEKRDYERDQITGWLATALENAGRDVEIVALYEREVRFTQSYQRLVNHLILLRRFDDANRWACEGIEKTIEKLPGIATGLARALGELAKSQQKWDIVAAHSAWEFFDSPRAESFKQLLTSASRANCLEPVKSIALNFLETGKLPVHIVACGKGAAKPTIDPTWPLPLPDYLVPLMARRRESGGPHFDVLIDMAIADGRNDDVLKWYECLLAKKGARSGFSWYARDYSDAVADAVAPTHPERSLAIYRQRVNDNLTHASRSAYQVVADYLRKMRPILKSLARDQEWNQLVTDIKLRYRNRPRFMEILDTLENKTILQSHRDRR